MAGGFRRMGAILALAVAALTAAACETLPYTDDSYLPTPVVVADGSAERAVLNARVYDQAVAAVTQRFYRRDFGGVDWAAETAARRGDAVNASTELEFYTVLNGVLALLGDSHTQATPPTRHLERQRARLQPRPNLGFTMRVVEDQFIVVSVREDSPAAAAGVRPGWRVDAVDGSPVTRATRLERADTHHLVFTDHAGQVHERHIPEAELAPSPGRAWRREDGVMVISFDHFTPAVRDWFEARMREVVADPPAGLIVDLRDNTGGLLTAVGVTLSPFFAQRQPYAYVEVGYLPRLPYRTRPWRKGYEGPVAVLISPASSSGAEVFAATLQESGRGLVIGETSAGAVIASRQMALVDGGELSIGMRAFRSGQGRVLEGAGVTPDVTAALNAADLRRGIDPVVEVAVAALKAGGAAD